MILWKASSNQLISIDESYESLHSIWNQDDEKSIQIIYRSLNLKIHDYFKEMF